MDESKRCCTCHEIKPLTEFNRRSAAADGLQSRCRTCCRAWYLANKDEHQANTKRRTAALRLEYRRRIGDFLREHPCVDCGESDVRVLDFDHEDASQKLSEIGRLLADCGAWSKIEDEMAKCSVRCANCHRRVTAQRRRDWRERFSTTLAEAEHARVTARLEAVFA